MSILIHLDGDGAWPDLMVKSAEGQLEWHLETGLSIACLPAQKLFGEPCIAFRIDLDDGRLVIVEASLKSFLSIAESIRDHFKDDNKNSLVGSGIGRTIG